MSQKDETPVNAEEARRILGGDRPWSRSYMSAVKKAMGVKGRYFFVSDVRTFIRENPDFKSKDSTFDGDTFKSLLGEALEYLRSGSAPNKLVQRIERKLA
jgi:hypothetical protein